MLILDRKKESKMLKFAFTKSYLGGGSLNKTISNNTITFFHNALRTE